MIHSICFLKMSLLSYQVIHLNHVFHSLSITIHSQSYNQKDSFERWKVATLHYSILTKGSSMNDVQAKGGGRDGAAKVDTPCRRYRKHLDAGEGGENSEVCLDVIYGWPQTSYCDVTNNWRATQLWPLWTRLKIFKSSAYKDLELFQLPNQKAVSNQSKANEFNKICQTRTSFWW